MLAALGVVLLCLGSFIEVVDISMAVVASLFCVFAVIEYGKSAPWLVFGVTAVISLVIIPLNSPAIMYTLFFGYYPILKEKFEKLRAVTSWVLKELVFNVALALMLVSLKLIIFPTLDIPFMLYLLVVLVCEVVFVIYDFALTRLISLYVYRLRKRFRIK